MQVPPHAYPPHAQVDYRRRPPRAWPGWMAFVLLLAAIAAFIWFGYLPMRQRSAEVGEKRKEWETRVSDLQRKLKASDGTAQQLKTERDELQNQHAQAIKEKEAAIEALNRLRNELTGKLEVEVKAGNIAITRRGNEVVVDVADKILFDTGKVEIKPEGKQILAQVAGTLASYRDHVIQVGGHTDSAKVVSPELREHYPTNWELSATRATNVVRFLQAAKISGGRLVAAGFAEFRPAASNETEEGRQKNRRIEIVLIPKQAKQEG